MALRLDPVNDRVMDVLTGVNKVLGFSATYLGLRDVEVDEDALLASMTTTPTSKNKVSLFFARQLYFTYKHIPVFDLRYMSKGLNFPTSKVCLFFARRYHIPDFGGLIYRSKGWNLSQEQTNDVTAAAASAATTAAVNVTALDRTESVYEHEVDDDDVDNDDCSQQPSQVME